jgi:hypothetical protein
VLRRYGLVFALLLALAGVWIAPRIEAVLVLADMAAGTADSPYKHITDAPRRVPLHFTRNGRAYDAELYRPAGRVRAGIVLVPGVQARGIFEPRLVAMATTLARAGFAVLTPEIPGMRALTVQASDALAVADACRWLAGRPGLVPAGRLGIGAVSYAVGPAMLAAMAPDLRHRIAFVLGIGGYYDLTQVLAYATTGDYRVNGQWRHGQPNRYGLWVFVHSNLHLLADARDRRLLSEMARRRLADANADIRDLAAGLGPQGRAVYALVTNTDVRRVPSLIAALPAPMRQLIEDLTLAGKPLGGLAAALILVHGRTDAIIPYTQSVALARAAAPGKARLFLLDGFGHGRLVDLDLKDRFRLWRAVLALLDMRSPA